VRLHGLPGSKRYADDGDEYTGLVRSYLTVLAELLYQDGNADGEREF
jgi:hypothetical protein